jgi:hypothetical protein
MGMQGQNVLIRTVTNYYTGYVVEETKRWLKLEKAAWIPDTGRFSTALTTGQYSEVEPYPEAVVVMIAAIVDITTIKDVPTRLK